ncbi:hypothetical protein, partial [Bacillus altitudinis]|uniref:hypothetical protein n=1 Tax=Bacillus altitudinis TaxID=293387 RepID=UPI00195506FD
RVLARSEFDIREHQRAGLTPNARVCLHAEKASRMRSLLFVYKTNLVEILNCSLVKLSLK